MSSVEAQLVENLRNLRQVVRLLVVELLADALPRIQPDAEALAHVQLFSARFLRDLLDERTHFIIQVPQSPQGVAQISKSSQDRVRTVGRDEPSTLREFRVTGSGVLVVGVGAS